jgi:hypothetical protein
MDVVIPPRGKRNQRLAPRRKKEVAPGNSDRPRPRGVFSFHLDVDP